MSGSRAYRDAGGALVLVLMILAIASFLAVSLLFATQLDYRASRSFIDASTATGYADSGLHEVLFRLNLTAGASAPPTGSTLSVNGLTNYDARFEPDAFNLLGNGKDDDNDGRIDEVDELNLVRDWSVRVLLTSDPIPASDPKIVVDSDPLTGPPWGSRIVAPTIQPQESWHNYSDPSSQSADVLLLRFYRESDTAYGDSEGDGDEIVFYDASIPSNGKDDMNSLTRLGSGSQVDEVPTNITWQAKGGAAVLAATGAPLLRVEVTGREGRARRRVEGVIVAASRTVGGGVGMCACKDLTIDGGVGAIDSYSALLGSYGGANAFGTGDIGSNGDVELKGNAVVSGRVFAFNDVKIGDEATLDGDAIIGGKLSLKKDGQITGTTSVTKPGPTACDCGEVDDAIQTAASSNDNSKLPSPFASANELNGSVILSAGTYYFESIDLKLGDRVQIGIDSDGDGVVDAPPAGPVVIYVKKKVEMSDDAEMNVHFARPSDLTIVAGGNVKLDDAAEFHGLIRAPGSKVDMNDVAEVFGAVVGKQVKYDSLGGFHLDLDLFAKTGGPSQSTLLAWRTLD